MHVSKRKIDFIEKYGGRIYSVSNHLKKKETLEIS